MRLNAHKGWRKTSVATASSRCNETRRQGCRAHFKRAESPTFSSDGFQPLYDTNARQGCRAHFKRAESPTGTSVGRSPTFGAKRILSPVRAKATRLTPFQGLFFFTPCFVGRCPTLVPAGLSALSGGSPGRLRPTFFTARRDAVALPFLRLGGMPSPYLFRYSVIPSFRYLDIPYAP